MNLKKTVAAGVVGVALLAGTAGTFATWQNSDAADAGNIVTGDMQITNVRFDLPRLERAGRPDVFGTRGTAFGGLTLIPGDRVTNNIWADITLSGLTRPEITVSGDLHDLSLNNDGFLVVDGEPTALRFSLETTNTRGQIVGVIAVDFVRSTTFGMYDNNLNEILGDVNIVITQG